ncbi:MAG: DUF2634 domain-containing protein [Clostridium thermopalmarium]|uniref:DUF2634 domain-containing protein n=1 Tax=Clostridium thermopalmarium TaxID=29373 RepID=UPI002357F755|nr:DUF2634 domain-containing protein [Clostridium thermopalmarium]MBE6043535.1 DUF2634 domain-containing protein [Clostridium thermopalmarium]
MSIFPTDVNLENIIAETTQKEDELPLFKEYAWDFEKNDFIYKNGGNVILEGNEALKVWIYKALKTERYKYLAYTWNYGHEFNSIMGRKYSEEYIESEAKRLLNECLLVNPYILSLSNVKVYSNGRNLHIDFIANTVYGEVNISV